MQKGEAHKKAIYGREIILCIHSFVKSFCRDFLKSFSPHSAHNPETGRTFALHRVGQKQGDLNCRLFAFALKMILNLILKTNLKTISDLKIESESDFQSDFESENVSRETWKRIHKKPIVGQKILHERKTFVKR